MAKTLPDHSFPGMYPIIYWIVDGESLMPMCGTCATEFLRDQPESYRLITKESSSSYDHDLPCEHCGCQLAAYYDPEDDA